MTPDFWPAAGHAHLTPDAHGWLRPGAAWFALWLQRPELALVPESCAAESLLHRQLRDDPLRPVTPKQLGALADADARDNYRHVLALRDALISAGTLEAWLLGLWRGGNATVPPLFVDLVVQAVLRGLLDGHHDAFEARAAELLFRTQRISRPNSGTNGRVLAGDRDVLDLQHATGGAGDLGRLLLQARIPMQATELQVLHKESQADYWRDAARSDGGHRFLLDLTHAIDQPLSHGLNFRLTAKHSALKALSAVLQRWVRHFLGIAVQITPLPAIADPQWRWHIGLDAEASALLNDLYEGRDVEPERQARLLSLFRLDFDDAADMRADVAGKPVWLGLMETEQQLLRVKPQNLLLNLPLARIS